MHVVCYLVCNLMRYQAASSYNIYNCKLSRHLHILFFLNQKNLQDNRHKCTMACNIYNSIDLSILPVQKNNCLQHENWESIRITNSLPYTTNTTLSSTYNSRCLPISFLHSLFRQDFTLCVPFRVPLFIFREFLQTKVRNRQFC